MSEFSTIAVVGASARSAAFSLLRAGYRVVTADLFADADLAQCCKATQVSPYPDGLPDWLAQCECDAWLYTGALENRPELVERMAQMNPLLGNAGEALCRCRDPWALIEYGLPVPETARSCEGLPSDGSWLCKTYRGSSGSGVWELADETSRQRAVETGAVYQRRVPGKSASAVFVLGEGWHKTLGITSQWVGESTTGAVGFQYAGSSTTNMTKCGNVEREIDRIGRVLAERFGLRGLVGVDVVLDSDQVWLLEVNPRYTASVEIIERSNRASAIKAHVAACLGASAEKIEWGVGGEKVFGKAVLYAKRDLAINQSFFQWAMCESGADFENGVADVPCVGSEIPAGRPVITVFATGENSTDDRFLRERVAEVESRLYGESL